MYQRDQKEHMEITFAKYYEVRTPGASPLRADPDPNSLKP